jgi:hypothetical protein
MLGQATLGQLGPCSYCADKKVEVLPGMDWLRGTEQDPHTSLGQKESSPREQKPPRAISGMLFRGETSLLPEASPAGHISGVPTTRGWQMS